MKITLQLQFSSDKKKKKEKKEKLLFIIYKLVVLLVLWQTLVLEGKCIHTPVCKMYFLLMATNANNAKL